MYHMIQHFTTGCMLQKIEIRDLNKYLYTHAHNSIIHKCQELETTQVSIDR